MKRTAKNIIMIILIAAVGVGSYFTMDYAGSQQSSAPGMSMSGEMGAPPSMPNDSSDNSGSSDSNQNSQPPEKPEGDSSNQSSQPPQMPSGDSSNQNGQPPAKPDGDNSNSTQESNSSNSEGTASTASNSNQSSQPPQMPDGMTPPNMSGNSKLDSKYYALFALEALVFTAILVYLILSGFNKRTFKETMKDAKKIAIYVLTVAIITTGLTFCQAEASTKYFSNSTSQSQMQGAPGGSESSVSATGATTVDSKEQTLSESYSSTTADESPILVTNGGNATIDGATITKSGDSTSTESSEFKGVNSGILVQESSTATIKNATISTDAKGSNAVFATGENAKIYISDSTINTTGSGSARGLDATYGGYIEADNVKITTQGGSCATLATDRGEGTVIAKNSTLETNGAGSPIIYSTGDIQIEKTKGTANGSQNVVIEGKNSATITNSTLTSSGIGNRNDVDNCGVMIYQSMSGDAGEGTGTLTAADSSLSISEGSKVYKTAPMFFITNTDAVINLKNTKLSFGSGVLISAKATSEWGNEGSNGGNVTLNAENQTLTGNIEADSISTVTMNLTSSTYEGTINGDKSAKEVTLKLDKNSKIKLTGDSYVTSLEDADSTYSNIDFNGHTLYVNGKALK